MGTSAVSPVKVALGGLGAVGLPVAEWLDAGNEPRLKLVAVSANDRIRAKDRLAHLKTPPPVLGLSDLADAADVIVECVAPAVFVDVARPAIDAGRILMPLTVTQLLHHMDLIDRARETGAQIIVPTGAIVGLDTVRAAAEGNLHTVIMRTHKPPKGFKKVAFVADMGIDLENLTEPVKLYEGSVLDAADKFPANVNVAVALGLAGIGPASTRYEIWADPWIERNTHWITVESDILQVEMKIGGLPTEANPATGRIVPLSVIAALKGLVQPLKVGT
ncbi:MAG: aspartate dehydrogenase [Rhodospirillaceae bacterium]